MDSLQKTFDECLKDMPNQLAAVAIARRAKAQGVKLSKRELKRVVEHLGAGKAGTIRLYRWPWWKSETIELDITDKDWGQVENSVSETLDDDVAKMIDSVVDATSEAVLSSLRRTWPKESRLQERERRRFRKRLRKRWSRGLDQMKMFLSIAREYGASVNRSVRDDDEFPDKSLRDALTRLHARACQVADEIICLLQDGLADGAMARWRTLHEISVVALFLSAKGENAAQRYIEHQVVESLKAATEYNRCCEALGYEPISDKEYKELKGKCDEAVRRYGDGFKEQYGWAVDFMAPCRPTIRNIEEAAGIEHLRAHYRMASHDVHANPKGIFFKLGLTDGENLLLAGPSDAGLADPGHMTAVSLLQVSIVMGLLSPNLDSLVVLSVLTRMRDEIGEFMLDAHQGAERAHRQRTGWWVW
ncbi:DUF5677 domain-containing protein [Candidatus Bipolaricaulota bacterium]